MNIFAKASKLKLRFDIGKGHATVEDLWDLNLKSTRGPDLDTLAIGLHQELQKTATVSFVDDAPQGNELLQLKFDVVKFIIDTKKAENAAKIASAAKKAQKDRILEIISQKQDEQLAGKSLEELQQMVTSL